MTNTPTSIQSGQPTGRRISDADAASEAERLDQAERDRVQVGHSTARFADMTIDDAYAVQAAWQAIRLARGESIVGHKIGLTSRAMQLAMKIDTPDTGFLTDTMVIANGACLDADEYTDPRLEVELAYVFKSDLSGAVSIEQVHDAVDYVVPAVELIAARSFRVDPDSGRSRTVVDTIADNAADAGIVVGDCHIDPRAALDWVAAVLRLNGSVEVTGVAAAVLGHPTNGIVWLARRYAEQGRTIAAGDIVLAGAFTAPVAVTNGDDVVVDYGPYGTIELTFRGATTSGE